MRLIQALGAGTFLALSMMSAPAPAQQFGVCGPPPLPSCERERPRVEERVIIDRRGGGRDFGSVCRTRSLRCTKDDERPIGARCSCEDEDGERVIGRIVR